MIVAVGGTATTDGGAGALEAIEQAGDIGRSRLLCLCDVRTPWERAASVFGPQKGADPAAVERLESRLEELAATLPRDPRGVPRTGAGGGIAGGLWAALDAELFSGAAWMLDAVGFYRRAAQAAAVITGEGRLDATTAEGKVVAEVAQIPHRRAPNPRHRRRGRDQRGGALRAGHRLGSRGADLVRDPGCRKRARSIPVIRRLYVSLVSAANRISLTQ